MDRRAIFKAIAKDYSGLFVEIGTDQGGFAEFILASSKCSRLYCVDPYARYTEYQDAINHVTGDDLYEQTRKRLAPSGERVEFVRKFSSDAAAIVPDELDVVYIDGNHSYKYVMQDLELWYPKVRAGGVLIGDDVVDMDDAKRGLDNNVYIEWAPNCYGIYGVFKAVRDFCKAKGIPYEIVGNQFLIRK